jgi:sugar phosphate isomerase/epimerase
MKIAISNIAWEQGEEAAIRDLMKRYGAAGVELAPTKIWSKPDQARANEIVEIREGWLREGFQVAAMQSLLFGHPEMTIFDGDGARTATEEYLKRIIQLGGQLGAGALVFGSPKNRLVGKRPLEETQPIAQGFFETMAENAVQSKTCFCLEPNPTQYGCDYVTTVEEALGVIREIDHPGLRLNLDTGILTMNGEPVESTLEAAFPWIGHVHISEPQLGVIGSGGVDHARIGGTLKQLGYMGWVSIEMRSGDKGTNAARAETALRTAAEFYAG